MKRSRPSDIASLIKRLGSRNRSLVDAARARLATIGPRAVEQLLVSLEGDDNRIRGRVMGLLALIRDPRGRHQLGAMLLDRSPNMREHAARALGRFPCRETVVELTRLFDNERHVRVRVAAVLALVETHSAGVDEAVGPVLQRMTDGHERPEVRRAALDLVPLLEAPERRGLLARLTGDADTLVAERARELSSALADVRRAGHSRPVVELVAQLADEDFGQWHDAVQRLASLGGAAVEPLIDAMHERHDDPEFCIRAGMALRATGPRHSAAIADALDRSTSSLPMQVLVETVGALGQKAQIYRLEGVIGRVDDPRVCAKAHLELARIGSRMAIGALRDALLDPERRVELELLSAAARVGSRRELAPLLAAYEREDEFVRGRIADALRTLMRRERIRRNSRLLRSLPESARTSLARILPPVRRRRGPKRAVAARRRHVV